MNVRVKILSGLLLCSAIALFAQDVKKKDGGATQAKAADTLRKIPIIPVYLGHSALRGGMVPKRVFDSLLRQGITSRDSLGNKYNVMGFTFQYAERNLYEDSIGRLVVLTDYSSEFCPGDTLSSSVAGSIYERTKSKDTVYILDVILRKDADKTGANGEPMKFVITR